MRKTCSICWQSVLGATLAGLVSINARALPSNTLEINLLDQQNGKPLVNAAVCLGTRARLDQFGAGHTDSHGVIHFEDIQPHTLVVTASGRGYQGRQQILEPLDGNRILVVKLVTGGGGPVCDIPPVVPVANQASLTVATVQIREEGPAPGPGVLVSVRVSGQANQIRLSERADFSGARWQAYQPSIPFRLSKARATGFLYVQVRRIARVQGASLEVVSAVKKVPYRVQ